MKINKNIDYKDIKDIYTYIKALNPKKFTTCQFTNLLYYHIKYIKVGIGPDERTYNIKKPLEFINKFIDDDKDREERDMFEVDKKGEFIFKDGEKIVKEHRYSKKNSTNTYNNVEYRKNFMNQDIFDNISLFEETGIDPIIFDIDDLSTVNAGLGNKILNANDTSSKTTDKAKGALMKGVQFAQDKPVPTALGAAALLSGVGAGQQIPQQQLAMAGVTPVETDFFFFT